jgi:membrane-associated phospholipid phosphatase
MSRRTSGAGTSLLLSTLALAVVVRRVARRQTLEADQQWAARIGTGQAWADRLSYLALPGNVMCEALAVALWAPVAGRQRASIVAAPLIAATVGHGLKMILPRDRPGQARFSSQGDQSFPSTHAALSTAFVLAAARVGRQHGLGAWTRPASLAVVGAIGVARLRASAHWPSDVVAGWLIGIASAGAAQLLTAVRG